MNKIFLTACLILASVFVNLSSAQSLSSFIPEVNVAKALSSITNDEFNWAFYEDAEHKKYFIDLEKLHIYLDKIEIINAENKVVFTDNLWNLPAEALYELDGSSFPTGEYTIRLYSLTEETKDVKIVISDY